MTPDDLKDIERQAEHFKKYGKRNGEWATGEESFCGPDGSLHNLIAEVKISAGEQRLMTALYKVERNENIRLRRGIERILAIAVNTEADAEHIIQHIEFWCRGLLKDNDKKDTEAEE